jgi:hypothetical protein
MSTGSSDNLSPGRDGEKPSGRLPWRPSADGSGDAGWEVAAGSPHVPVELPSRRWYIEAAGEAGGSQ